jgi:hypothetical protein
MARVYFYAKTLKGITTAVLKMFDDVQVDRYAADGVTVVGTKICPIKYSSIEKHHAARLESFTEEDEDAKRYYLQIPRMALTFDGMAFAPTRQIGINEYRIFSDPGPEENIVNTAFQSYSPIPYDYTFTLYIRSDKIADTSQLLEQILIMFSPRAYLMVKEYDYLNVRRSLSVKIDSTKIEFDELEAHDGQRMANASITLTVEGFIYAPVSRENLVKVIRTKYFIGNQIDIPYKEVDIEAFPSSATDLPTNFDSSGYDIEHDSFYYLSATEV